MILKNHWLARRQFLGTAGAAGLLAGLDTLAPAYAKQTGGLVKLAAAGAQGQTYDLQIGRTARLIAGREAKTIASNGTVPGPLVRLKEGQNATLSVTNLLPDEDTSIHWHGILLPANMDGVPGVSYAGIKPGETFTHHFPVRQSGTYWYHSHSGLQEQLGHYGPLIIDPAEPEPFTYDRDYVVMLSDWMFENPYKVLAKLKKQSDYNNFQKQTLFDFFKDASEKGWSNTIANRAPWARMRMSPTDIADITGHTYTYLMNGLAPEANWTGLFRPGERVRLRFINAATMSYFDIRIPGLKMAVVQADGQNVQPVSVDEFRFGPAETYDVIVTPQEDRAYTLFAEAMDRSGFSRGTLAPREGMTAALPERRERPLRTMADMGMDMEGMDMGGMDMSEGAHADMNHDILAVPKPPLAHGPRTEMTHGPDHHGPGAAMIAMRPKNRMDEPGIGLTNTGTRVLVYNDLRSVTPAYDKRPPGREIELHLTGNMDRYMWSFDGKKFSQVDGPIRFNYGERLRLTLVNDTMMDHPIHLHGMWMELENDGGEHRPRKHTISLKPGEMISALISADAMGDWAFHCHLLFHMDMGMFRVVSVSNQVAEAGQ